MQFRVRQTVVRRVGRIRDTDIQIRRYGVDAGQPSCVAVTVLPALLRAADAHQLPVIVPRILTVKLREVQVPAL
ncbi:hypothetical protein YI89_001024 [Salmonella enterica subsp. enterica]|nr:hypothetical protein [Salmonella enterica subsp. enterica]